MSWLRSLLRFVFGSLGLFPRHREDCYHPSERLIYSYWDGSRVVKSDPMTLYKRLMEVGPELNIHIKVANSPLKDNVAASEKVVEKIHYVFGTKPYHEGGLTESEAGQLLGHFLAFCEGVKKNSSPTSTAATPSPTTGPSSGEDPPTGSISASNSTGTASCIDGPTPSPSGPDSSSDSSKPPSTTSGPTPTEREKPSC